MAHCHEVVDDGAMRFSNDGERIEAEARSSSADAPGWAESSLEFGGKGGASEFDVPVVTGGHCVGLFSVLIVLAVNTFGLSFYGFNYLAGAHFTEVNDLDYKICIMDFAYKHG